MKEDKKGKIQMEPGIYNGIKFEDYCRIDAINHSTLKAFMDESPFHYRYKELNGEEKDTKALSDGRVIHEAVLETDLFKEKYVEEPKDWRDYEKIMTKQELNYCKRKEKEAGLEGEGGMYFISKNSNAYRTIMDAFEAKLGDGKHSISSSLLYTCKQINNNLKENTACQKLFKDAKFEVTMVWIDEETGLKCKGRLDVDSLKTGFVCDLKKTKSAHPIGFAKDVRNYKYNSAAAFYMDGAMKLGHEKFKAFVWLACEDVEPYYILPFYTRYESDWIQLGREWYRKAIEKLHYCKSTGDWHGYYDSINDSFKMHELPELLY